MQIENNAVSKSSDAHLVLNNNNNVSPRAVTDQGSYWVLIWYILLSTVSAYTRRRYSKAAIVDSWLSCRNCSRQLSHLVPRNEPARPLLFKCIVWQM